MNYLDSEYRAKHPEGLNPAEEQLATELFEIGAIQFGNFKLKLHEEQPEAPLSPVYADLRVLPLWPEVLKTVSIVYSRLAEKCHPFDFCLGIPDAGVPLATAFSLKTDTPQIVIRKTAKTGHGLEGFFLTPMPDNLGTVLLIDDLMTTAGSKEETLAKLKQTGLEVADVIVLIDRDQNGKGKARLAIRGVSFHAAFTIDRLLNFYARIGRITNEQLVDTKNRLRELNAYLERA